MIFAYMYQPNVPCIYRELKKQTFANMFTVMLSGSCIVVVIYMVAATFGYITWAGSPEEKVLEATSNILYVDYQGNVAFSIALVTLTIAVFAAAPMCVLPSKDSYEALIYGDKKMTSKQNLWLTITFAFGCLFFALIIPGISDAITILGYTINPIIGFIFPCLFYLKLNKGNISTF